MIGHDRAAFGGALESVVITRRVLENVADLGSGQTDREERVRIDVESVDPTPVHWTRVQVRRVRVE